MPQLPRTDCLRSKRVNLGRVNDNGWLTLLTVLAIWLGPSSAWAHGGGPGLNYDPCARQVGSNFLVHFAAYQPQFNQFEEHCGSLPRSGNTLLVFDLIGAELPDLPISIDLEDHRDGRRLSVPARFYRSGVIDLEANLAPGNYSAVLEIGEPPNSYRVAFAFSVGVRWTQWLGPFSISFLIFCVTAIYCIYQVNASSNERYRSSAGTLIELPRRQPKSIG